MKVLIIDDSVFSRQSIKRALKEINPDMQIIEADRAMKGIEIFKQETPDLVLTDLVMPEVKGDTVVKYIHENAPECFVAMISANIQERVKDEIKQLGANCFVEKPIKIEKLEELLKVYKSFKENQS